MIGAEPLGRDGDQSGGAAAPFTQSGARLVADSLASTVPAPSDGSAAAAVPLESLPLASLVIDGQGTVTAVNTAWAALSRLDRAASLGHGWLESIEPLDRRLIRDRVRSAAARRQAGSAECRLTGPEEQRWTRWWWQPTPTGGLVVCVADIDDERTREASLWQRATHDPLTGVVNRAHFVDLVDRALERRDRTELLPAVVYVDLDGFKTINDNGGHHAGDRVLRAVAERMAAAIRPADVIARVGGDEFAVLCEALHHPDEGDTVAERIHLALSRAVAVNGEVTPVTATTGVAVANPDDTAETLLARADQAMYAAKRQGRRATSATIGRDDPAASATATAASTATARSRPSLNDWDGAPVARLNLDEPASHLADAVIGRVIRIGLILHGAASVADDATAERLQQAVEQIDALIRDIRAAALERVGPVGPSTRSESGLLRPAMDALLHARQLLTHSWTIVAGDTGIEPDIKDRLVQAARLAHAAAQALSPDAVGQ